MSRSRSTRRTGSVSRSGSANRSRSANRIPREAEAAAPSVKTQQGAWLTGTTPPPLSCSEPRSETTGGERRVTKDWHSPWYVRTISRPGVWSTSRHRPSPKQCRANNGQWRWGVWDSLKIDGNIDYKAINVAVVIADASRQRLNKQHRGLVMNPMEWARSFGIGLPQRDDNDEEDVTPRVLLNMSHGREVLDRGALGLKYNGFVESKYGGFGEVNNHRAKLVFCDFDAANSD